MGTTWGKANGPGGALRAAGYAVFTAPETKAGDAVPTPCVGPGEPTPGAGTVVQTNGDTNDNGAALAQLIAFLHDNYGVTNLHLVGHSDGGLWSRAAITQDAAYTGVTIQSLTTLGTPHTGSYLADLAMELNGGRCDFSNSTEQDICDAVVPLTHLIVNDLGPEATFQLSNDFLATWNPQQRIGDCPVSTIAGDHVSFGLPFLGYYTPSDGLVGLDSAQAKDALDVNGTLIQAPYLPGHRQAGVYDVVHGASLSFLYSKTLLNQTEISDQVTDHTLLSGPAPCNLPSGSPRVSKARSSVSAGGSGRGNRVRKLRAPLYRMVSADGKGRLPKPGPEDFAVSVKGVSIRCGKKKLPPIPLLGDKRIRIHDPGKCKGRLRATRESGKGLAGALMLVSNPNRHVSVTVNGDRATFRVQGRHPRNGRVQFLRGGKWRNLKLDRKGRTRLPEKCGRALRLRVRVARAGDPDTPDTANLELQR